MKVAEIIYRYDAASALGRTRPASATEARERLEAGSRTIAALVASLAEGSGTARRIIPVDPRDLGIAAGVDAAPPQRPYAAVLGCSDARVPIELIFNEGPNDLFVVRVAGNGLGGEVLGSLKYAVDHLGASLKLIVVLGHSGCGAVSTAVDIFLDPSAHLELADEHALRSLLDRLLVVVHASARRLAAEHGPEVYRRSGYRDALIESAVALNAALTAHSIQKEIAGSADPDSLRTAYGVYLLDGRQVWAPRGGSAQCEGLAYPPVDPAGFAAFAASVLRSERITALLGASGA